MSTKVRVQKVLVASGDLALVAPGTALNTGSTLNISSGQLGIFANGDGNLAKMRALGPGDDIYDAPGIKIVQGTPDVASLDTSISPLPIRGIESSEWILSPRVTKYSGISYTAPTNSAWVIGREQAESDKINILEDTRYQIMITIDGRIPDLLNGRNHPSHYPEFTTPASFTDAGYTTEVAQRNFLVQNLAAAVNRESKFYPQNPNGGEFVALAIDEDGVGSGTAISALAAGNVTVGKDDLGNDIVVAFTAEMVTAVKGAIVANGGSLANTAEVIAYNPEESGVPTSGECDAIIIVAVDRPTAYFDRIPEVKSRLNVGLPEGFSTSVFLSEISKMSFGFGLGRQLELLYQSDDALRKFATEQAPSGDAIQYASPVVSTATYDVYTIEHRLPEAMTNGSESETRLVTHILNAVANTTTTAALEAVLNPWMVSAGQVAINL